MKIFILISSQLLLLMFILIQSIVFGQNTECNRRTNKQLDSIFAKMYTFGNSGRNFPLDSGEAKVYCNETMGLLKTAERYVKNCLKEYPKRLLTILINTVRSQSRSLCGKDSKRLQELFLSAPCSNAAKNEHQKCINSSVDILLGIKYAEQKQKIPLLCCGNHKMQKCLHDESIKLDICNEDKIEKSLRFLDSIQGNMLSLLCSQFDDSSDTCDKLEYPKKHKNQKRTQSIVMPMIRILDSIIQGPDN